MTKPTEVAFNNSIGQTINPGDNVVVVTSGYGHGINISQGTYLGKRGNSVVCKVEVPTTLHKLKATGEIVDKYKLYPKFPTRNYAFRFGTLEYQAETTRYNEEVAQYQKKTKAVNELFEDVKAVRHRQTTLQRNRIFKIDTPAVDIRNLIYL